MTDETHADCPYQFHSSLLLYAMVHKPLDTPSMPAGTTYCGDMQMICHRAHSERLICTYLSPLDAVMGSKGLRDDDHFWPIDFRCVDTRHFMEQNGGLAVSVNYAYAADRNRLVVGKRGHPIMVYTRDTFDVPQDRWDHFTIRFAERVSDRINDVYSEPACRILRTPSTRWIAGPPSRLPTPRSRPGAECRRPFTSMISERLRWTSARCTSRSRVTGCS